MTFKKVASILLFALITANSYAQDSNVIIKFCPFAAADVITFPTIQGGIEFRLSNRISWYNELGIKYRNGSINQTDSSFIKSYGFKVKSEVRYYLHRHGKRHFSMPGYYFAANAFLIEDHYNTEIAYTSNNIDGIDAFGVKKGTLGINVLAGRQVAFYKRFMVDVYCGFGLRYRNINTVHEDYNNNIDTSFYSRDPSISEIKADIDTKIGKSIVPNFTFGLRLCFKL